MLVPKLGQFFYTPGKQRFLTSSCLLKCKILHEYFTLQESPIQKYRCQYQGRAVMFTIIFYYSITRKAPLHLAANISRPGPGIVSVIGSGHKNSWLSKQDTSNKQPGRGEIARWQYSIYNILKDVLKFFKYYQNQLKIRTI